jgi:hypothetical protein
MTLLRQRILSSPSLFQSDYIHPPLQALLRLCLIDGLLSSLMLSLCSLPDREISLHQLLLHGIPLGYRLLMVIEYFNSVLNLNQLILRHFLNIP